MSTPTSTSSARNEVRHVVPRLIERPLARGVAREAEIGELITPLAVHAGWPGAMSAARVAKRVFEESPA
jgi:alkylhydroperoxidase/carboxymuconolactone decarboxylase family protein YurZ